MAVGAATILGSFAARLGIDTGEYSRGILSAQAVTHTFGASFTAFITNPLLGSIDLFKRAAVGAVKLGADVLGTAERIQLLSRQTGASTDLLQAMELALKNAGKSAEAGGDALLMLARNLDAARTKGGESRAVFERLGIDIDRLGSTDEALAAVLTGLDGITDAGTRSAAAMELLGRRSGPDVVTALGTGRRAIDDLVTDARRLNALWGRDTIRDVAELEDAIESLGLTLPQLGLNAMAQLLAGFSRGLGDTSSGVGDLAADLGNLLPEVREFGVELGTAASNAKALLQVLNDLANIPNAVPLVWQGFLKETLLGQAISNPGFFAGFGQPSSGLETMFPGREP